MSLKSATVLLAARQLESHYELRSRLESAGILVITAAATGEALERLREESPQLALLDHDLEPVSSASLMLAMRKLSPPPEIILLNDGPPEGRELIQRELGLLYYGVRPEDPGVLFDLIRDTLKKKGLSFSAPSKEPPLVMCVDDDSLQLSSLYRVLTRHGYRVEACENALRALSRMTDVQPDVAVIDLMMPGTDGMELIDRLQRRSGGRIPVVLLSAINTPVSRKAAKDRGVRHYLTKPCADREVLAAIQSSLAAAER